MHGDAARNSDTDGSDLAFRALLIRRAPDSTATRHLGGDDSKVGTGSDDGFFHPANVCNHVERVGQRHDGVTHELSWAVPGDPTTSVDVDDNGPVGGAISVLRSAPGGEDLTVFKQQQGGRSGSVSNRGVDSPLQFPRFGVVDEVVSEAESAAIELFDIGRFQRGGGLGHDTTLLGGGRDVNPGDGTQVMRAGRGFVKLLPVTTVVFLHGVGGAMPGWDTALTAKLAELSGTSDIDCVEIGFDDLIDRSGVIRRRPAEDRHIPVVTTRERSMLRQRYQRRQIALRKVVWDSPDRVEPPTRKPPTLIPGEVMVRLPFLGMRQAGHYRHDDNLRAEVLDRIAEQLNAIDGPIVLLAHSLGSVVALDALHVRDIHVQLLVSFGSPLGVRDFWGKAWQDPATFPYDRLGSWLNIVNVNDPVTWKRGASDRFPQALDTYISAGNGIAGPMNYHDAATYTSAEILARAVDAATSGVLA